MGPLNPRSIVSSLLALSVLLSGCGEVEFVPRVTPLVVETAPPQVIRGTLAATGAGPIATPAQEEFDSSDALELCGRDARWGDVFTGMCLAPGGDAYYVWISPDEVAIVDADLTDPRLLGFFQAANGLQAAENRFLRGVGTAWWRAALLGLSLVGLPAACIGGGPVGCVLDGALVIGSGGLVADLGAGIADDVDSYMSNSRLAHYYFCLLQGGSDTPCRESAGIGEEDTGLDLQ